MSLSRRVLRDTPVQDDKVTLELSPIEEAIALSEQITDSDQGEPSPSTESVVISDDDAEIEEVEPAQTAEQQAEQQAAEIVAAAQVKADQILGDAQAEKDKVLADARNEGYQVGHQEGFEVAKEVSMRTAKVASQAADRIVREEKRLARALEASMAQLAIEIARKVLREELESGKHRVEELAKLAVTRFSDDDKVVLRLNPEDIKVMEERSGDVAELFDPTGALKVIEDRRVSKGGCVVETPSGKLDARHEAQLDRLTELFSSEANGEASG